MEVSESHAGKPQATKGTKVPDAEDGLSFVGFVPFVIPERVLACLLSSQRTRTEVAEPTEGFKDDHSPCLRLPGVNGSFHHLGIVLAEKQEIGEVFFPVGVLFHPPQEPRRSKGDVHILHTSNDDVLGGLFVIDA